MASVIMEHIMASVIMETYYGIMASVIMVYLLWHE